MVKTGRNMQYQWTGDGNAITNKAPDSDDAMETQGAPQIAVQLTTPAVAAGTSTFSLMIISSSDGGATYDSVAVPFITSHSAQAESVTQTKLVNTQGLTHIKFRLTVSTTNPGAAENTTLIASR